jgi:ligand-binding SRPBCC domain-containing protein
MTVRLRTLRTEQWLPRPIHEVFGFFSDAHNLDLLTPPWLRFRILTPPPVEMRQGTRLDYRLRWRGLPLWWRTEIAEWQPPHRFIDRALRSPFRLWVHEHTFEALDGGTRMLDRVEYAVPGWLAEPILARLLSPDIERIFAYRRDRMLELFCSASVTASSGAPASARPAP